MVKKPGSMLTRAIEIVGIKNLITVFLALASVLYGTAGSALDERISIPIVKTPASSAPDGWKIKEWRGRADFEVVDAEFGPAVHLRSKATSSALYRDVAFDIREYPVIHWRWKVTTLPKNADVRNRSTDDQAAQVYVIFPRWPAAINSRVVGYIWDTGAPAGLMVKSAKSSNTGYVVIRSGSAWLGQWYQETRNVYEDYKKIFHEEPPKAGRVSLMIDSDDTASFAESFIGDIYFTK